MIALLNRMPIWIRWILYIFLPYLIGRLCVALIGSIGYFAFILAPSIKFKATLLQLIIWNLWKVHILAEYILYLIRTGNSDLLYSWMSIMAYVNFGIVVISMST